MDSHEQYSFFSRLLEMVIRHAMKSKQEEDMHSNEHFASKPGSRFYWTTSLNLVVLCLETLCEVIKSTVIKWGRSTHIHDPNLIREMFKLIYNQYDGIGEVRKPIFIDFECTFVQISRCLDRTYVINEKSVPDISLLLRKLSIVRALLTVQMDSNEEEIMISCLK